MNGTICLWKVFCGKVTVSLQVCVANRLLSKALLTLTEKKSIFGRVRSRWSMTAKPHTGQVYAKKSYPEIQER